MLPAWFFLFVLAVVAIVFIGLPWLVFHFVTRWKTAATLTHSDERLLEEMYALARRMDERVATVERIVAADNPHWREIANDPAPTITEDTRQETLRRIK
ncbi:MAG: envelope stress response membrane protein PspB [Alphaproteobacteria bacterium]|nr:envelope stress response membrane protein PspB [Alphaproteobacteria bacterium]